jgi:hypothetical protein
MAFKLRTQNETVRLVPGSSDVTASHSSLGNILDVREQRSMSEPISCD